jgi:hypothetical protein
MKYAKRVPAFVGRRSSRWEARPEANLLMGGFSAAKHLRKAGQTPNRNYTGWRTFARALCMGS